MEQQHYGHVQIAPIKFMVTAIGECFEHFATTLYSELAFQSSHASINPALSVKTRGVMMHYITIHIYLYIEF